MTDTTWLITALFTLSGGLLIGYLLHRAGGILQAQDKRDDDE
jgi:hypothetical protein